MAKLILGICGEMGSGKGTIAQYLTGQKGGGSHRFSTMLRDVLDRLFIDQSRENIQNLSTMLRQTFGDDLMAKVMYHEASKDQHDIVVIDGVRRLSDIIFLQKLPEFKLIYVEAIIETRYTRISTRGENADDNTMTFEEFVKAHQAEPETQILDLKTHADIVLDNNGSLENLHTKLDQIIDKR